MKAIVQLFFLLFLAGQAGAQGIKGTRADSLSLQKQIHALGAAFAKGDAHQVALLHHPDIVKYFGKDNVVIGRAALEKGLAETFKRTNLVFIENTVESTVFTANTCIQTCIFAVRSTPKNGEAPSVIRGRSMVTYIRDKSSPTGWLSLREMTQEAPDKKVE